MPKILLDTLCLGLLNLLLALCFWGLFDQTRPVTFELAMLYIALSVIAALASLYLTNARKSDLESIDNPIAKHNAAPQACDILWSFILLALIWVIAKNAALWLVAGWGLSILYWWISYPRWKAIAQEKQHILRDQKTLKEHKNIPHILSFLSLDDFQDKNYDSLILQIIQYAAIILFILSLKNIEIGMMAAMLMLSWRAMKPLGNLFASAPILAAICYYIRQVKPPKTTYIALGSENILPIQCQQLLLQDGATRFDMNLQAGEKIAICAWCNEVINNFYQTITGILKPKSGTIWFNDLDGRILDPTEISEHIESEIKYYPISNKENLQEALLKQDSSQLLLWATRNKKEMNLCDRLLFIAQNGKCYDGKPSELLPQLQKMGWIL